MKKYGFNLSLGFLVYYRISEKNRKTSRTMMRITARIVNILLLRVLSSCHRRFRLLFTKSSKVKRNSIPSMGRYRDSII